MTGRDPTQLRVEPECPGWATCLKHPPSATLLGRPAAEWRLKTRRELGLATDRPIVATGHQTLLWHPGILAKYLVVDAFARSGLGAATANLIVDQHAEGFGTFDVPIRRADGSLAERRVELTRPRDGVPMGLHEPFDPAPAPTHLPYAIPAVTEGVERVLEAVRRHRDAPNAALQMALALSDLMRPWIEPMPNVTAGDLLDTSLGRALMDEFARDPQRAADHYNRAVDAHPHAGIGHLLVRDDYVEAPLWRLRADGTRMHAYDSDIERRLEQGDAAPPLLPRALLMTALVRLGMCDLFVHGTGGANYDRAMEMWIRDWLGVEVAPRAVATADLYLPLAAEGEETIDLDRARAAARRAWHDPEPDVSPGPVKRAHLHRIDGLPRRSPARRQAFFKMHEALARLREEHDERLIAARERRERAVQQARDAAIASRRDWAFPLYPRPMIDRLAAEARNRVTGSEISATPR